MKPLTENELANLTNTTKVLVGARLQEVSTHNDLIALAFWSEGKILWLLIDLNNSRPILLPFTELPISLPNKKTPLNLFLRAHFIGKLLKQIELKQDLGRIVELHFSNDRTLELRLFPHGANAIAKTADKSISHNQPKALVGKVDFPETNQRDLNTLRDDWLATQKTPSKKSKNTEVPLKKREHALKKVYEEIRKKKESPFREIGNWLVKNQTYDVPPEWLPYIDKRRKLAWNIEECFRLAKENERKIHGTEERAKKLKQEIEALRQNEQLGITPSAEKAKNPLTISKAEGRTLKLSPDVYVVAGKSAADNLKLLRKARAWDFWVHVKDHPSSHAIVFRNKKSELSQGEWHQVAQWFLKNSLGNKAERFANEKFEILIAECRHITPIKGDKLGRVTYRNERVMPIRFTP